MNESKFTVLAKGCGFLTSGDLGAHTLDELIGHMDAEAFYWAPVQFWEWTDKTGKDSEYLRAECLAAGRLIDCINGKYIPRIPSCPAPDDQQEVWEAMAQPAHVSHVEPERAPLPHFNQRTPFDAFPDFIVVSGGGNAYRINESGAHPLQKVNEGGNALCGSAWLLVR